MASIATAFANVKDYLTTYVPDRLVRQTCQDIHYQGRERRPSSPWYTIWCGG